MLCLTDCFFFFFFFFLFLFVRADEWEKVRGMEPASVVAIMLQSQYYSTIEAIGAAPGTNSIFVPSTPNAVGELTAQLRDSMIMADAAKR